MRKSIIVIIALVTFSGVMPADYISGNKLLAGLEATGEPEEWSFALGYVTGVFDSFNWIEFEGPDGVSLGQLADIAKKYLKEHPELRHITASAILDQAFREAFPKPKE